ncbi:hypothetical protein ANN_04330 [Periplaneta americana]|uniref:Uncharacterized protein n=1 Tax=Periplaneta americana TaxID=6978 RepID=A0ABQ8T896_PERAM|nr:hypothetical protein ANN_04330 [Periplaneta americana]
MGKGYSVQHHMPRRSAGRGDSIPASSHGCTIMQSLIRGCSVLMTAAVEPKRIDTSVWTFLEFYEKKKEISTLRKLLNAVKKQIRFNDRKDTFWRLSVLKQMTAQSISEISKEAWIKCCQSVKHIEDEYWRRDALMEEEIERIVINIGIVSVMKMRWIMIGQVAAQIQQMKAVQLQIKLRHLPRAYSYFWNKLMQVLQPDDRSRRTAFSVNMLARIDAEEGFLWTNAPCRRSMSPTLVLPCPLSFCRSTVRIFINVRCHFRIVGRDGGSLPYWVRCDVAPVYLIVSR